MEAATKTEKSGLAGRFFIYLKDGWKPDANAERGKAICGEILQDNGDWIEIRQRIGGEWGSFDAWSSLMQHPSLYLDMESWVFYSIDQYDDWLRAAIEWGRGTPAPPARELPYDEIEIIS